jgi:hypothetical protein
MKDLILNNLIRFTLVFSILLFNGCAALNFSKWQVLDQTELGFCIKVPAQPRHFTMERSTPSGNRRYHQWTINDNNSDEQYFVVYSEIDRHEEISANPSFADVPKPEIGFLTKAAEISSAITSCQGQQRQEQTWLLENRINKAVSHTYIHKGNIFLVICLFPANRNLSSTAEVFFDSFELK